ncbi:MAG: hypothetical protein EU535_01580 [Promethearchaeota archaeon]|nr:MAG: hypothetical protein EU535_01580 [Candidatus Lokiarchaeota archaeon]
MPNTKIDPKKSSKNSYMMSFRMDKDTYHKLNLISKENNIKKSELLRNSFNEWINLKKVLMISDTMIIGKNILKGLFNFADEKEIIDLGKNIAEIWLNEFNIHLIDMQAKKDIDSMLTTFTDGIGPNEANWFDKINYQRMDNGIILIYGIHSLNKKFSLFFKAFLEHLMAEEFKFILIHKASNISNTTIRFEFKLADNK